MIKKGNKYTTGKKREILNTLNTLEHILDQCLDSLTRKNMHISPSADPPTDISKPHTVMLLPLHPSQKTP